jgi:hypothetical protein
VAFVGNAGDPLRSTWLRSAQQLLPRPDSDGSEPSSVAWNTALFDGYRGDIAFTEDDDVVAATGAQPIAGYVAFTEDADVVAATGFAANSGTIAFTEADDIVTASGATGSTGTIAFTEADDVVAATGALFLGIAPDTVDGATVVNGPAYVGSSTVGETTIYPGTVDGASSPVGPSVLRSNDLVVEPEITVSVWSSGGALLLATLNPIAANWQDPLNDIGSGSIEIPGDDPNGALFVPGNELHFTYFGETVFVVPIARPASRVLIAESEESGQTWSYEGSGLGREFFGAKIHPFPGSVDVLAKAPQHRLWSFASKDFPNASTWIPAVEGLRADERHENRFAMIEYHVVFGGDEEDFVENVAVPAPLEWMVGFAKWIWGSVDMMSIGDSYFRRPFTITTAGEYIIDVTADNYYTLYLDGQPLMGDSENAECWQEFRRTTVQLEPGDYWLAAKVTNSPGPFGASPAGFLMTMYTSDGLGGVGDVIVITDQSWAAIAYPPQQPGWTVGQILLDMLTEVQARGLLTNWTPTFTAFADSNGTAWPYVELFSQQCGNSLLDALQAFVAQGWIDWRVLPGRFLDCYVQGGDATDTGVDLTQTFDADTQVPRGLNFESQFEAVTRVLAKWGDGYITLIDTTAETLYPINEGYLTIDAGTRAEADRLVAYELTRTHAPSWSGTMPIAPTGFENRPYFAFRTGDMVDADDVSSGTLARRIQSITVNLGENGRADPTLEIEQRAIYAEQAEFRLIQTLGSGVVGDPVMRNTGMSLPRAGQGSAAGPATRPLLEAPPIRGQSQQFVSAAAVETITDDLQYIDETALDLVWSYGPVVSVSGNTMLNPYLADRAFTIDRMTLIMASSSFDATPVRLYVNGVIVATQTIAIGQTLAQTGSQMNVPVAAGQIVQPELLECINGSGLYLSIIVRLGYPDNVL